MRKALKWTGIVLGSLVVLVLVVATVLYVVGGSKQNRTYAVQTAALVIPTDSAAIARGAHLAATHGCLDCHGADLGGQVMVDAPPFRVTASNLTRGEGGIGGDYTAEDLDRAIRHGVLPDGRPVVIMPSGAFHRVSNADAAALIAYLQRLPPVDRTLPSTALRPLGRVLAGAGALDLAFEVRTAPARRTAPAPAPTAEYGEYLATALCTYCHGEDLAGMQPPNPSSPPAPTLAAAARWSLDDFKQMLRTGTTPDGRTVDPAFMPISATSRMDDTELAALHAHLQTVGPARAPES